jgi:NAD(P)-dependent dehydrogenase (short-subunit alcohol dehydrogenase family)
MTRKFSPRTEPALRLAGRRILITGGASGIGRRTAEICVAEGATVALLDRNADLLKQVADETGAFTYALDLTDEAAVNAAIDKAAAAMGGIDGLVNSAGVLMNGPRGLENITTAEWTRVLSINLTAPFVVSRGAIKYLKAAPGHASVVNVSSGAGLTPAPAGPAYGSAKAGLIMLSHYIAHEFGPGIRANSISPGATETPMLDQSRAKTGGVLRPMDNAMQRTATADEMAHTIVFLLSDEASYITGAAVAADGGGSYH